VFALGRWGDERKNRLYEQRFLRLFNLATVPAYWSALEGQRGRPDFKAFDAALEWARKHGLAVEAHPLLWDETVPPWLADLDAEEARAAAETHVRRLVGRAADRVAWWDLVCPAEGDFRAGSARIPVADAVRWSAEAAPAGRLVLIPPDPQRAGRLAETLAQAGAPGAAVGLLAQQHEGTWPVDLVQQALDASASARLPVRVVAVTILGGPEEEADQAEAVRRFYMTAFAQRQVGAVSWWDLSDRFAWQSVPGGLVRSDLSPKPAYNALDRLINRLWRTDAAGRTDEDGRVGARAFFGRYRITARADRRTAAAEVEFGPDGPRQVDLVLPPARSALQPETSFSGATRSS
jgi:GH35 family endo-1,4-beta-xylanase